jgi:predicted outer membrane repeat protein
VDEYGKATIKNSRFTKNTSPKGAGTVVIESSTALIKNCVFYKNNGCNGAAINVKLFSKKDSCRVKIISCSFTKNSAAMYGGAICSVGGKVTVKNSRFSSNTAKIFGGAIYARLGNLYVSSSKFIKNKANYAGAICMASKKGSVKYSVLSKNKAYYRYSAVYKVNKNKIIKSKLKSNKCLKYSKIYFHRSGKYIMVKVKNNTDGTVKKRVRLIFTGPKKVKTKWYKTSDKKYKKIRIPKSVKGTYKVTVKVKKARYFKKAITVKV